MRPAYSSSSAELILPGEEFADRRPHVVLAGEAAGAHGAAGAPPLGEELRELRLARAEGGEAAGLDVAAIVRARGDVAEQRLRRLAVLGGVLAVGGVEEVDVGARRIVALLHHVERELRDARAHRAAAGRSLEELAFVELPRLRGVREEHRLDLAVLAADALQREEEEMLGELPLRVVHAEIGR